MVCDECNRVYIVKVDVDLRKYIDATELDIEIPYCPFCGSNIEYTESFDNGTSLDL
jgi:hypothetical protein